ncbi:hypothetical protein ACQYRI_07055 [Salmonella enterica]
MNKTILILLVMALAMSCVQAADRAIRILMSNETGCEMVTGRPNTRQYLQEVIEYSLSQVKELLHNWKPAQPALPVGMSLISFSLSLLEGKRER